MITLIYDGSLSAGNRASVYINGSAISVTQPDLPTSVSANMGTRPIYIGYQQDSGSGYYDGKIDEVAIWNTALTSTQVQSIYDATSTNLTKDLTTVSGSNLVYWNRMGD
jgi:MSHA biogenesis protein MshQ